MFFIQLLFYTLDPNTSSRGRSSSAVMDEEIWAVMVDINNIPMIIHSEAYTMANLRYQLSRW